MAINFIVQSEVVDIRADTPKREDSFLIDTNVWYWLTYTRASQSPRPPAPYQSSTYPNYTNVALGVGAKLFQSCLNLAELTHLIEKTERDIYEATYGRIGTKEYRHNLSDERTQVVEEILSACGLVMILGEPLTIEIDTTTANSALNRLQNQKVDGYDLFILECMKSHGLVKIITDDGDFTTVPGIQVFTANRNVIKAANDQGRLLIR